MLEQGRAQLFVRAEQPFGGLSERRRGRFAAYFVGQMPTCLAEWLVARAALLPVPDRLVDDGDRGQNRDLLEAEDEVGQVGDRAVAVLKVERIEELLSFLGAQLLDAFEHALARTRILRQRVCLDLGGPRPPSRCGGADTGAIQLAC